MDSEALDIASQILGVKDFYQPSHALIYEALLDLQKQCVDYDLVAVSEMLEAHGSIEKIGGAPGLIEIANVAVTSANVEHHSSTVKRKARQREQVRFFLEMQDRALKEEPDTILQRVIKFTQEQSYTRYKEESIVDVCSARMEDWAEMTEQIKQGNHAHMVETGFRRLDELLQLKPCDMCVLAARPSVGKTALALQIAAHVAKTKNVLFLSFEMSNAQIADRMMAAEAPVNLSQIYEHGMSVKDVERGVQALGRIEGLKMFLNDQQPMVEDLRPRVNRLSSEHGPFGMIVVDYLQLMQTIERHQLEVHRVASISRQLKLLALNTSCSVLLLSQLSRSIEQRDSGIPRLSDLRDSGAVEQDADQVVFLTRSKDEPETVRQLHILKNRNGVCGMAELNWLGQSMRFEEDPWARRADESEGDEPW